MGHKIESANFKPGMLVALSLYIYLCVSFRILWLSRKAQPPKKHLPISLFQSKSHHHHIVFFFNTHEWNEIIICNTFILSSSFFLSLLFIFFSSSAARLPPSRGFTAKWMEFLQHMFSSPSFSHSISLHKTQTIQRTCSNKWVEGLRIRNPYTQPKSPNLQFLQFLFKVFFVSISSIVINFFTYIFFSSVVS